MGSRNTMSLAMWAWAGFRILHKQKCFDYLSVWSWYQITLNKVSSIPSTWSSPPSHISSIMCLRVIYACGHDQADHNIDNNESFIPYFDSQNSIPPACFTSANFLGCNGSDLAPISSLHTIVLLNIGQSGVRAPTQQSRHYTRHYFSFFFLSGSSTLSRLGLWLADDFKGKPPH